MNMDYTDRIKQQRSRKKIMADYAANAGARTQPGIQQELSQLQLEVLLDMRDILLEMREWLPTRE